MKRRGREEEEEANKCIIQPMGSVKAKFPDAKRDRMTGFWLLGGLFLLFTVKNSLCEKQPVSGKRVSEECDVSETKFLLGVIYLIWEFIALKFIFAFFSSHNFSKGFDTEFDESRSSVECVILCQACIKLHWPKLLHEWI